MTRIYASLAAVAVVALLAASGYYVWRAGAASDCGVSAIGAQIGGPFTLTRHDGVEVTDKDVIDGLTLIYFGYTYCPDVCPVDTARNAEAVDIAAEKGVEITPVMITIDPARDTAEAMADYASWLHPTMVGLTGTEDQIAAAVAAYRVYAQKTGEGDDYLMAHSNFTYLMAPKGLLAFFKGEDSADKIAEAAVCLSRTL